MLAPLVTGFRGSERDKQRQLSSDPEVDALLIAQTDTTSAIMSDLQLSSESESEAQSQDSESSGWGSPLDLSSEESEPE